MNVLGQEKNVSSSRRLDIQYLKNPPKLIRYLSENEHIALIKEFNRSKNKLLKLFIGFFVTDRSPPQRGRAGQMARF